MTVLTSGKEEDRVHWELLWGGQAAGIYSFVLYRGGISGHQPCDLAEGRCSGRVLERRPFWHALCPALPASVLAHRVFPGQLSIPGLRGTSLDPLPLGLSPGGNPTFQKDKERGGKMMWYKEGTPPANEEDRLQAADNGRLVSWSVWLLHTELGLLAGMSQSHVLPSRWLSGLFSLTL